MKLFHRFDEAFRSPIITCREDYILVETPDQLYILNIKNKHGDRIGRTNCELSILSSFTPIRLPVRDPNVNIEVIRDTFSEEDLNGKGDIGEAVLEELTNLMEVGAPLKEFVKAITEVPKLWKVTVGTHNTKHVSRHVPIVIRHEDHYYLFVIDLGEVLEIYRD